MVNKHWPPDYSKEFATRARRIKRILKNKSLIHGAKQFYKDHPVEFIEDWCCTYDPRNSRKGIPNLMPFILFDKQKEYVNYLHSCLKDGENGLIEKARDMGATWVSCAFTTWLFLFHENSSVGWGSRKEMYVDKIGDPDSIFEKIRLIIDMLPPFLRPKGYDRKKHALYMRIINPENGSTISGEAGDNIGRGGRSLMYFVDEAAWLERAELVEASLGDNTDVRIDISSVHGTGNVYHNKRKQGEVWAPNRTMTKGKTRVFIFDWKDHPNKTQEWYDTRYKRAEAEGMLHIFKQEVDRDYSGAIENVVIPGEWVRAAVDAHKKLGLDESGKVFGGLDVADEGGDLNAFAVRKGVLLSFVDKWGQGDTYHTASESLRISRERKVTHISYDSIGVGAGVKAAFNKSPELTKGIDIKAWNAATAPLFPTRRVNKADRDSPTNKDFYSNLKAQGWWELRKRFHNTYKAVRGDTDVDLNEVIAINGDLEYIQELIDELSQPVFEYDGKGRVKINKKPNGTKSPNMADAVVMAFWPILTGGFFA